MTHDRVEPWTGAPPPHWITEVGLPAVWFVLLLGLAWRSMRRGEATFGLLVLISFSTLFWQDAYINWGMYLLYNPHQTLMPWGPTPFTAPRKVWWTIFAYGIFWLAAIPATQALAGKLRKAFPKLGNVAAIALTGFPVFYVWDLLFEGSAVRGGFYSYVSYWGPAIVMRGGNLPLLFPIAFIAACGTGFVLLVSWRGSDGRARFESWFPLHRIVDGPIRELARLGVWVLVINAAHFIVCAVPLTAIRLLLLQPSALVP